MYFDPKGQYATAIGVVGAIALVAVAVAVNSGNNAAQQSDENIFSRPDEIIPPWAGSTSQGSSASARAECESDCDLGWDNNKAMCQVDAAMRGYNADRYRQCMNEADRIYIECIQDCKEDCK